MVINIRGLGDKDCSTWLCGVEELYILQMRTMGQERICGRHAAAATGNR